jgi:retinol dehydrogenase-12
MKPNFPKSKGALVFLHLDLEDLASVKAAAEQFLAKEGSLDVLFNNAGIIAPQSGRRRSSVMR